MPDEPPPPPPASDSPKSTALPSNIAAALACIPLIGGIVFFILEKQDPFVRFYSMQSIVFGMAWFLFNIVSAVVHAIFGAIPAIGGILVLFWAIIAAIIDISFVVLSIIASAGRRLIAEINGTGACGCDRRCRSIKSFASSKFRTVGRSATNKMPIALSP